MQISEISIPMKMIQAVSENAIPSNPPRYSIVIPVFNESEVIPQLLMEIRESVRTWSDEYEILMIDDGSVDQTPELIERCFANWRQGRLIRLAKNCGQAAALYCGMKKARGRIIILMDGDGQNDPSDLPGILEPLTEFDMVVGVRVDRKDNFMRRVMSRVANKIRGRILNDSVLDSGCGIKAFHRSVVDAFIPIRTLYSFIPALAISAGFSVKQVPVRHRARLGGESKYGVRQFLWRPFLDMLGVWWFTRRRCTIVSHFPET
jgi:dolichol-phosphate mannosyltransferase